MVRALAAALAVAAVVRGAAAVPANSCSGAVMGSDGAGGPVIALPHANVTGAGCGVSVLTDRNGTFSVVCAGQPCLTVVWSVWARQYEPMRGTQGPSGRITLTQRPIPGFPASAWRFEGWAIDASESLGAAIARPCPALYWTVLLERPPSPSSRLSAPRCFMVRYAKTAWGRTRHKRQLMPPHPYRMPGVSRRTLQHVPRAAARASSLSVAVAPHRMFTRLLPSPLASPLPVQMLGTSWAQTSGSWPTRRHTARLREIGSS